MQETLQNNGNWIKTKTLTWIKQQINEDTFWPNCASNKECSNNEPDDLVFQYWRMCGSHPGLLLDAAGREDADAILYENTEINYRSIDYFS